MSLCAAPQHLTVPPPRSRDVLSMALVIPLQGPAGIFGPSCESCATLAMEEINAQGGVLGRELNLVPVDGGAAPSSVAKNVDALIRAGAVEAVTGWHISAVREAVAPVIDGRVPYAYTALYEGGEHRPGVFLTGETPDLQLGPALRLVRERRGRAALDDRRRRLRVAPPVGPHRAAVPAPDRRHGLRRDVRAARHHGLQPGVARGWSAAAARP